MYDLKNDGEWELITIDKLFQYLREAMVYCLVFYTLREQIMLGF
jgi:hypothetical protein